MNNTFVLIGEITGSHGIKGHLKLRSFTFDPFSIFEYSPLLFENGETFSCKFVRNHSHNTFIISIKDIDTRTKSDLFKGKKIYIQKDLLKNTTDDEYYFIDIEGCSVLDGDEQVGKVMSINDFGAGIFLDVKLYSNGKIATLPFIKEAVLKVDIPSKQLFIDRTFLLY